MNIANLITILEVLRIGGYGDKMISAEHDVLNLVPPGVIKENSEVGRKLIGLGVNYDEDEYGWYVFV